MNILYLLVPLALLLAGLGVWAFAWAVRKGQFDDVHTPAMRMLVDEEHEELRIKNSELGDDSAGDKAGREDREGPGSRG